MIAPANAWIQARSRRQAMDWSLVLVSQGIDTEIQYEDDEAQGPRWGLVVPGIEYDRALGIIRQYRLENRRWPWRREIKGGIVFDGGSIAWVLLVCFFYWVNATRADLRASGAMDSTAVGRGELWRLFTAIWLHADIGHLAANASIGLVLLGLTMGRYRTGVGLLAAVLAGAGGNAIAGFIDSAPHRSLGASGLVMGCLGLLAAQSFFSWRRPPFSAREVISGLVAGAMLFILMGLTPGTDILAHFGGFISGLALGLIYAVAGDRWFKNPLWNAACGFLFILAVVIPWYLALKAT